MKYFRSMTGAIAALAMLAASPAALAQVGPGGTMAVFPQQFNNYAATVAALAPAASATDLVTITGVANSQVRVRKMYCTGISTANATALLKVIKRSTANSAGTATTPTKVPLNSAYGVAASAVVRAYTANPTVGTAIGDIALGELTTGPRASATLVPNTVVFDFSNQNVILNSASEVLAINGNGASFTSGAALDCGVEWQE